MRLSSLRTRVPGLIIFLLIMALPVLGEAAVMTVDSLPPTGKKSYKGYRLHLTNIQVVKKGSDWIKIKCDLINTGRENIQLKKGQSPNNDLLVQFDQSLSNNHLLAYEEQIGQALHEQNKLLIAGQIQSNAEIRFSTSGVFTEKGAAPKTKKKKKKPKEEVITMAESEEAEEEPFDRDKCPDILIEDIKVLKKSKNWITLAYTITNNGKGSARILGKTKSKEDNIAIRANLSSSSKLTKGAIVLGGDFFNGKDKLANGFLPALQSCSGTIKLDIRKMTRYTSVIILELDAYDSVRECDETNNRYSIAVD